ncbi:MAG: thiol reductase thioredoxin [Deltaproteobacteria bacterium]|nr:thiol reductase thioredoxin [Deltaproteobacteria bacterium]
MSADQKRPESVPENAWWDENDQEWIQGEKNDQGALQGTVKYWRADGTLCNECEYVDGTPHGPFKRFHENGDISQEGQFENGKLHGTRTFFASDSETTENMPAGLSEKVFKAVMEYDLDSVVAGKLFDRDGQRIKEDGSAFPEIPKDVPEDAQFSESSAQWYLGSFDENNERSGKWRFWSVTGEIQEETEYKNGEFHGQVKYFRKAKIFQVITFQNGAKNGAFQEIVEKKNHTDTRIRIAKGMFENNFAAGTWMFYDSKGQLVLKHEFGKTTPDEEILDSPIFSNQRQSAQDWFESSRKLLRDNLKSDAICALARAAASEQKAEALNSLLERITIELTDQAAMQAAETVLEQEAGSLAVLGNAIIRGADAASLFRGMAVILDQKFHSRAALDLVNAALLLAPERTEFYYTRSLINMSLGNDMAAAQDATHLEPIQPDNAAFLSAYVRVLFPVFNFWPANENPETHYDDLPEAPVKTAGEIHLVIQKYATRLHLIREQMLKLVVGRPDWLLPDMLAVLPGGLAELECKQIEVPDPDDPDEPFIIDIDETIDVANWELPALLRAARDDWNAVTWLCWATGYDHITLPTEVNPPVTFDKAAGMAASRLWRCRDRRITSGFAAKNQEVPGFKWEAIDIDELHPSLVQMAESQYAEMQAMFYWLTSPDYVSPWQDNLRGS